MTTTISAPFLTTPKALTSITGSKKTDQSTPSSSISKELTVVVNPRLSAKAKEDYRLVQAAIAGNQKAYEKLLNRYKTTIFHAMYKRVNNREDADDLTLEAFGKAFHKLPTYVPRYAFSTWLFKIANNNCIDHIRKKRIQAFSIDDPIEPEGKNDFSSNLRAATRNPEQDIIRTQKLGMVREVISHMPFKYRLMIELRYFEEMSYDEIARELGIPLGTVKAQLFRAKQMLKELISKPGPSAYLEKFVA